MKHHEFLVLITPLVAACFFSPSVSAEIRDSEKEMLKNLQEQRNLREERANSLKKEKKKSPFTQPEEAMKQCQIVLKKMDQLHIELNETSVSPEKRTAITAQIQRYKLQATRYCNQDILKASPHFATLKDKQFIKKAPK